MPSMMNFSWEEDKKSVEVFLGTQAMKLGAPAPA
jgi:hypothetical protein